QRQIDGQASIAEGQAGDVVPAAANGHDQVVFFRERDGGLDIRRARAPGNHGRAFVDHRVPDLSRLRVLAVLGRQHRTLQALTECGDRAIGEQAAVRGDVAGHVSLLTLNHGTPEGVPCLRLGMTPRCGYLAPAVRSAPASWGTLNICATIGRSSSAAALYGSRSC